MSPSRAWPASINPVSALGPSTGPSRRRACLQCLRNSHRLFSSTPRQETRLRRNMFRWLTGPGDVFREAPSGTPNYLGGYTREGFKISDRRKKGESAGAGSEAAAENIEDPEEVDEDESGSSPESSNSSSNPKSSGRPTALELRPFPNNIHFRSPPVLDEETREEIWRRVMQEKKTVRNVSVELGVDMNRVGAVVRLKEVEKQWIRENKPLAVPYSRAILAMLPKTSYQAQAGGNNRRNTHESINDLPVHPATTQQIFHLTSESRVFTRSDAAKIFDPTLLPADARLPHPELIEMERENIDGIPQQERIRRAQDRAILEEQKRLTVIQRKKDYDARTVRKIPPQTEGGHGGRWEWRFKNISVQDVGADGRAPGGTGWRYGVPHQDRKRGQIKIPTKVG
ncbi:MAG: hypothetical protein M1823_000386 [Watsoniomyces obsoletus]|nr:MAG: hypothetical protein M1823_000386 [Watsoniomyces obsoletus]